METHVSPASRGQRVPPREDPALMGRVNADTARCRLPEQNGFTFTHTSGNGEHDRGQAAAPLAGTVSGGADSVQAKVNQLGQGVADRGPQARTVHLGGFYGTDARE